METNNEIILDLRNLSSSSQEVNLFVYSSEPTQTVYSTIVSNTIPFNSVTVTYSVNGVSTTKNFLPVTSVSDLVSQCNTFFSSNLSFEYESYSATESKIFVTQLNSAYQLTLITYEIA